MTMAEVMLAEFEVQAPITRRFLERLPEDNYTWKPHERSMSAGQLALHLASVPGGVIRLAQQNPAPAPGADAFQFAQPSTREEVLRKFDDLAMNETWRLASGDQEFMVQPRAQFLRDIMLSHWYQHRGQFSVYLRMLNIAVPSSWGPSADEAPAFLNRGQSA